MKCNGTELEFKSIPSAYYAEVSGAKNHTERLITRKEAEWIDINVVRTIRIANTRAPTQYFIRKIINIYKEGDVLGMYLYSFTWVHEEVEI